MRLRNVKNAENIVSNSKYTIKIDEKTHLSSFFMVNNPIHLEIGVGKGDFLIGMAKSNPNINFVGIEKYESVLVRAIEKCEELNLENIRFIRGDAGDIVSFISHEIDTLYLNFSDPWPKKRHAKRRLTSPIFLQKYDSIFECCPHIKQKTDNICLFAYSLETLSNHGYILKKVTLDLEHEDIPNVITEYESKFMSMGIKINYLEAIKDSKQ